MPDAPPPGLMFQASTWKSPGDGTFWDTFGGRARELADAGFTHVWLPPPCKGAAGVDDIGYALYDLDDLGEFDQKGTVRTRWGTREQLGACTAALRKAGVTPLADVVLNHRMGADQTERFTIQKVGEDRRLTEDGEPFEIEAYTRFDFPGRDGKYSEFGWRWHHYTAVDHREGGEDDEPGLYRIADKDFAQQVGQENENYDYLMGCDLDLQQEDVREELMRWGRWFIDASGVDGFRLDAAKHMSAPFIRDWLTRLREETGRELFSVAEYAIPETEAILTFFDQSGGSTRAFDFPLHYRFGEAANDRDNFDLRTLFDDTLVAEAPDLTVTFVENHDSDPAQGQGHWVDDWFKPLAYAAILLREGGLPCVYAGDYDGRPASDDPDDEAHGYPLTPHRDVIDKLIDARRRYGFGGQEDHLGDPTRIAWVRTGTEEHPGVMVVVLNRGHDEESVEVETRPDTRFRDALREDAEVTTDGEGKAAFTCPAGGVAVWLSE